MGKTHCKGDGPSQLCVRLNKNILKKFLRDDNGSDDHVDKEKRCKTSKLCMKLCFPKDLLGPKSGHDQTSQELQINLNIDRNLIKAFAKRLSGCELENKECEDEEIVCSCAGNCAEQPPRKMPNALCHHCGCSTRPKCKCLPAATVQMAAPPACQCCSKTLAKINAEIRPCSGSKGNKEARCKPDPKTRRGNFKECLTDLCDKLSAWYSAWFS